MASDFHQSHFTLTSLISYRYLDFSPPASSPGPHMLSRILSNEQLQQVWYGLSYAVRYCSQYMRHANGSLYRRYRFQTRPPVLSTLWFLSSQMQKRLTTPPRSVTHFAVRGTGNLAPEAEEAN